MLVTLYGTIADVREVQFSKAPHPILSTLLGIVTDVREAQPRKA
jgi:hypothetical protein